MQAAKLGRAAAQLLVENFLAESVDGFGAETATGSNALYVRTGRLRDAFQHWCKRMGFPLLSAKMFGLAMSGLSFERRRFQRGRSVEWFYFGIALKGEHCDLRPEHSPETLATIQTVAEFLDRETTRHDPAGFDEARARAARAGYRKRIAFPYTESVRLYEAFSRWCEVHSRSPITPPQFYRVLSHIGARTAHLGVGSVYLGIQLNGESPGAQRAEKSVSAFLAEKTSPGAYVKVGRLHAAFNAWCADTAHEPLTSTMFGRVMSALSFERARRESGPRVASVYLGFDLTEAPEANRRQRTLSRRLGLEPARTRPGIAERNQAAWNHKRASAHERRERENVAREFKSAEANEARARRRSEATLAKEARAAAAQERKRVASQARLERSRAAEDARHAKVDAANRRREHAALERTRVESAREARALAARERQRTASQEREERRFAEKESRAVAASLRRERQRAALQARETASEASKRAAADAKMRRERAVTERREQRAQDMHERKGAALQARLERRQLAMEARTHAREGVSARLEQAVRERERALQAKTLRAMEAQERRRARERRLAAPAIFEVIAFVVRAATPVSMDELVEGFVCAPSEVHAAILSDAALEEILGDWAIWDEAQSWLICGSRPPKPVRVAARDLAKAELRWRISKGHAGRAIAQCLSATPKRHDRGGSAWCRRIAERQAQERQDARRMLAALLKAAARTLALECKSAIAEAC